MRDHAWPGCGNRALHLWCKHRAESNRSNVFSSNWEFTQTYLPELKLSRTSCPAFRALRARIRPGCSRIPGALRYAIASDRLSENFVSSGASKVPPCCTTWYNIVALRCNMARRGKYFQRKGLIAEEKAGSDFMVRGVLALKIQ